MWVIYNKFGTLQKVVTNTANGRVSTLGYKMVFYFGDDFDYTRAATITFRGPDGEPTQEMSLLHPAGGEQFVATSNDVDFTPLVSGITYPNVYSFSTVQGLFNYPGIYHATVKVYNPAQTTPQTIDVAGRFDFYVEDAVQAEETYITVNQYQDLLGRISGRIALESTLPIKHASTVAEAESAAKASEIVEGDIYYAENTKKFYKLVIQSPNIRESEEINFNDVKKFDTLPTTQAELASVGVGRVFICNNKMYTISLNGGTYTRLEYILDLPYILKANGINVVANKDNEDVNNYSVGDKILSFSDKKLYVVVETNNAKSFEQFKLAEDRFLPITGGTLTGDLSLGQHNLSANKVETPRIQNVKDLYLQGGATIHGSAITNFESGTLQFTSSLPYAEGTQGIFTPTQNKELTPKKYVDDKATELNNKIDAIKSRGRYLSILNAEVGSVADEPSASPYTYKSGDYFIVGTAGFYKPTGTTYTIGGTNFILGTDYASVNDTYYFDGTNWSLLAGSSASLVWGSIGGTMSNQTDLQTALNGKQATLSSGNAIDITSNTISVKYDNDTIKLDENGKLYADVDTEIEWGDIGGTLTDQTDLSTALSGKESTSNKVVAISGSSTDTQYASAKCVWDNLQNVREVARGKTRTLTLRYAKTLNTDFYDSTYNKDGVAFSSKAELEAFISGLTNKNSAFNSDADVLDLYDYLNSGYLLFETIGGWSKPVMQSQYATYIIKLSELAQFIYTGDEIIVIENRLTPDTGVCPDRWFGGASMQFIGHDMKVDLSGYATTTQLATKTNESIVANEYDSTATYSVGDKVMHDHKLYECNTAISVAESWDSSKWTEKLISGLGTVVESASYGVNNNSLYGIKIGNTTYKLPLYTSYNDGMHSGIVIGLQSNATGLSYRRCVAVVNETQTGGGPFNFGYQSTYLGNGIFITGKDQVVSIGDSSYCGNHRMICIGKEARASISGTFNIPNNYTYISKDLSNLFFLNENNVQTNTTFAQYTAGYTLAERLNGLTITDNSITELDYNKINARSISTNTTFTFKAVPTSTGTNLSCNPEYKLKLGVSAQSTITLGSGLTFKLISNDDNIVIANGNELTLPIATKIELSIQDGLIVALNHDIIGA